jgi:hypothetical protein
VLDLISHPTVLCFSVNVCRWLGTSVDSACWEAALGLDAGPRPGVQPAGDGGLVTWGGGSAVAGVEPGSGQVDTHPERRFAMAEAVAQAVLLAPTLDAHQLSRSVARRLHLVSAVDRHAVDTAVLAVVAFEEGSEDRRAGTLARGLTSSSSAAPPPGAYALRGGRPPVYSPTLDWEGPRPATPSSSPIVVSDEDPGGSSVDRTADVEP